MMVLDMVFGGIIAVCVFLVGLGVMSLVALFGFSVWIGGAILLGLALILLAWEVISDWYFNQMMRFFGAQDDALARRDIAGRRVIRRLAGGALVLAWLVSVIWDPITVLEAISWT